MVYLVMYMFYEDTWVQSAYSSRDAADLKCNEMNEGDMDKPYIVMEYELL